MEVYTLTITLLGGRYYSPWKRVVEMPADTVLVEISDFILDTIGFDEDHGWEFFTGRNYHNKDRVFAYGENYYLDKELESPETKLEDIYPLGRQRLYYFFDWGDSWLFEFRKANKRKTAEPGVEYPRIIEAEGENPQQYPNWDDEEEDWEDDEDEDDLDED